MAGQLLDGLAGLGLAKLNQDGGAERLPFAVRGEGDGGGAGRLGKLAELPAVGEVPAADHAVRAARERALTVGRHYEVRDRPAMPVGKRQLLAGRGAPDAERVARGDGEGLAVGRK